jgi:hypothetical protein
LSLTYHYFIDLFISKTNAGWSLEAHTSNPSYSESKDQEDQGSNPAQANSLQDPLSKKPITRKRAGGMAQGIGPELNISTAKMNARLGAVVHPVIIPVTWKMGHRRRAKS